MDYQFPTLKGVPYLRYLARMHRHLLPNWYLEVGTNTGRSLARATCNSIAVDPNFIISSDVIGSKPAVHFFQSTSDDFFSADHTKRLCDKIDLAFLDGLHLFEFLLRDFMGTEKLCDTDSVIAMHDCIPMSYIAAERHWDTKATKSWTGDVWKVVPILKKYRPDLKVEVLDCPPSGLTIVTNLDPENDVLDKHYDEIIAEFMDETLSSYGEDRLIGELDIINSQTWPANRHIGGLESNRSISDKQTPKPIAEEIATPQIHKKPPISFSIKSPPWGPRAAKTWGETFFAEGLTRALQKQGHEVSIDLRRDWYGGSVGGTDIVLRTPNRPYEPVPNRNCLIWSLYGADLSDVEINHSDHIFVSSSLYAKVLRAKTGATHISPLLQAFDAERMKPTGPSATSELLYVGNNHNKLVFRKSVQMALVNGVEIDLYGRNWESTDASRYLKGEFLANKQLSNYYRGAGAVLNDHSNNMGIDGYVSNRIFDVLACGTAVVTDKINGLPEDLKDWLHEYSSDDEFLDMVALACNESAARKRERVEFAEYMKQTHSFDQRAIEIIKAARRAKPKQQITRKLVG